VGRKICIARRVFYPLPYARLLGMVLDGPAALLFLLAQAMAGELYRALRGLGLGPAWALHPLALWLAAGAGFRVLFHACCAAWTGRSAGIP